MADATRVLLSDLDDTLFDHAYATRSALAAMRATAPAFDVWTPSELEDRHRGVLDVLHLEVLAGRLTVDEARVERFRQLLEAAGADRAAAVAIDIARGYRDAYQRARQPVPGALAFLQHVRRAGAQVVIVTNNVVREQRQKLAGCGLTDYVDVLVTSEEVGVAKPDKRIFDAALAAVGARPASAVMFGDAWATDIEGARAAGIRPVWFNRFGAASPDPSVAMLASLEPAHHAGRVVLS